MPKRRGADAACRRRPCCGRELVAASNAGLGRTLGSTQPQDVTQTAPGNPTGPGSVATGGTILAT